MGKLRIPRLPLAFAILFCAYVAWDMLPKAEGIASFGIRAITVACVLGALFHLAMFIREQCFNPSSSPNKKPRRYWKAEKLKQTQSASHPKSPE